MWRKALLFAALLLLISAAVAQPAQAQTVNTTWRAEFFNNTTLTGTPEFTRQDSSIAFNWGTGQPDSRIGADNFSARWATDVALNAGTYRVFALADDNVRVTFNFGFQPVIDTFATGQVDALVTGDFSVGASGTYHIQIDYRELTGPAFLYVAIVNVAAGGAPPAGFPGTAPIATTLVPTTGSGWTAQYYANANLLGDPTVIVGTSSPSINVGSGSPFTSIPADNFSARFSSVQNLPNGTYNITVRADDGVRVFVNGVLVINQWQLATGQTYSVNVALPAGSSTFVVEYFESSGEAFLEYSFSQVGGTGQPVPQQTASPAGITATVTAFRLNVRNAPEVSNNVITRISRGETYSVLGRNAASTWYQVDVNGTPGWISAGFVNIAPAGANVPLAGAEAPAQTPGAASGNQVQARPFNVVIRQGPGTQFSRIGLLPVGQIADVIGRNSNNTWWQINYNGLIGWTSAQFAIIAPNANTGGIPVTQ